MVAGNQIMVMIEETEAVNRMISEFDQTRSDLSAALDRLSRNSADAAAIARHDMGARSDVDFRKRVIGILDQALEVSRALTLDANAATSNSGVSDLALNL